MVRILTTRSRRQHRRREVWLLDVQTRQMRRLLDDPSAEEFSWAPGGQRRVRPELVATHNAPLDQIVHDCSELRSTGVKLRSPRRRRFVQVQAAIHLDHDGAHS